MIARRLPGSQCANILFVAVGWFEDQVVEAKPVANGDRRISGFDSDLYFVGSGKEIEFAESDPIDFRLGNDASEKAIEDTGRPVVDFE